MQLPADLSEVVYAVRSLRRHLSGRAWASGTLEVSGLESLAQTARRTVSKPWRFALRRKRGGGIEVQTAPPGLIEVLRSLARGPLPEKELPPRCSPRPWAGGSCGAGDTQGGA